MIASHDPVPAAPTRQRVVEIDIVLAVGVRQYFIVFIDEPGQSYAVTPERVEISLGPDETVEVRREHIASLHVRRRIHESPAAEPAPPEPVTR